MEIGERGTERGSERGKEARRQGGRKRETRGGSEERGIERTNKTSDKATPPGSKKTMVIYNITFAMGNEMLT